MENSLIDQKGKLTKEYYILKDDDETYGERYILSKYKPTVDESQLKIVGTINVSGDVDLFEKISHL